MPKRRMGGLVKLRTYPTTSYHVDQWFLDKSLRWGMGIGMVTLSTIPSLVANAWSTGSQGWRGKRVSCGVLHPN